MPYKTLHLCLFLQLAFLPSLFSQTNEQLRANLYTFDTDGTPYLFDGNLTMYDVNNSNAVDDKDAVKMSNFGENFGLQRGATTLVIERRQSITTSDTVFFKMWNMEHTNYKLELQPKGLNHPGLKAILEDLYLNTTTDFDLNSVNSIPFTITSTPASARPDRFRIIFADSSLIAPSEVTFLEMNAIQNENNITIKWKNQNEKNISKYQIQKSMNGLHFFTIATIDSKGINNAGYKWTDNSTEKNNNFYRITSINKTGSEQFGKVVKVVRTMETNYINVYPNPVVNGSINIHFIDEPKGIYTAKVINNFGQLLNIVQAKHNGGTSTLNFQLTKNIHKGIYTLEIIKPDNTKTNTKIFLK